MNLRILTGGERVRNQLLMDPPFDLKLTLEYDQGHRWRPDREHQGWYTSVLAEDVVRIRQKTRDGPSNLNHAHKK